MNIAMLVAVVNETVMQREADLQLDAEVPDGLVGLADSRPEPAQSKMLRASPARFTKGEGIALLDEAGERYLDGASGTFNVPLGYSDQEVVDALIGQLRAMAHVSSAFVGSRTSDLIAELAKEAPGNIDAGWMRDLTGSTANECAVKIAQKATGRTDVVSLFLSHHGQTQSMAAISGNAFRRSGFPGAVSGHSLKVPAPYCHRCFYNAKYPQCGMLCVERIGDFLEYSSNGAVACLIVEPILGNGGNIVPPAGYFEALRKLCDAHDIILIADEVQTGMGRTGHFFACDALGLKPNIITLAKGLGGIGIPVAAVLYEARLDVLASHDHSFTSGANPLALAAAEATLRALRSRPILENVRKNGALLGTRLNALKQRFGFIGDVRGLGFMWGLEIETEDGGQDVARAKAILDAGLRHKLILRGSRYGFGNVVKVRPPLIANEDDIDEIIGRLTRALSDVQ